MLQLCACICVYAGVCVSMKTACACLQCVGVHVSEVCARVYMCVGVYVRCVHMCLHVYGCACE